MLFETLYNRLILRGTLVCQTAVRIGAGKSTEPVGTDMPVLKDIQDRPFIPGSSLKGILRSRVESFVRAIHNSTKAACNPVGREDDLCLASIDTVDQSGRTTKMTDDEIYDATCLVCKAFGSPWLASKIQMRDALVTDLWFGQYQVRDGVAINRDTQTAEDGLKYDYEVVPAQTRFDFHLVAENLTPDQIGMLFVGLRPFERQEISIGGFRSRGLGVVQLDLRESRFLDVQHDPERLFRFLEGDDSAETWTTLSNADIRATYLPAFFETLQQLPRNGDVAHA